MGIYIIPSSTNFFSLSGGTVTGDTLFSNSLSATTYYSGSTPLEEIIYNLSSSYSGYNYSFSASNNLNVFTSITNSDVLVSYSLENNINLNSVSAQTIYSGSTELGSLFITPIQLTNAQTLIQNGLNTYTGGTNVRPNINISALTINTLNASGNSIVSANFTASTIFSGSSNIENLFSQVGHTHEFSNILNTAHTHSVSDVSNLSNLLNTTLNLSGGTMTGGLITPSLSANTLSGETIYSGTTDLSSLFVNNSQLNNAQTFVQNGTNTYTGGTSLRPTVNVSALTINTLFATGNSVFSGTLSGGSSFFANTLFSGSTNLNSIFSNINHTHQFNAILNTAHTHSISEVDNLSGLLNTKLNLSGGTMTGGIITSSLSATSLSGGTIYSGSTNLNAIFATIGSAGGASTFVQPGTNIYTGGTSTNPTVNVSALTINTLFATGNSVFSGTLSGGSSFSANTLFSGSTNLNSIFSNINHTHQFSTILNTAHTHSISDVDNLFGSLNTKLNLSGGTMTGGLITTSLSATTLSGGTIYSGSTNLNSIFATIGLVSASQTFVQPGTNTYTGGTTSNPTVNVSALTSGNSVFSGTLSGGSSFSANTLFSGSTNLNSIFSQLGHTHQFSTILNTAHTHSISEIDNLSGSLNTKLNLSGGTMTGGLIAQSLSATTLSGGTIYSGSTNLNSIFSNINHTHQFSTILNTAHTHSISEIDNLSELLNTKLNLSGGTMTGGLITTSLSATTLSGGTIYSGSTNLYSIFSPIGSEGVSTFVQPGTNTYTGGTSTNPTVNISALTINTLSSSGNSVFSGTLSGGSSFSANTIQSNSLAGGGTVMVVVNNGGLLSTQAIPSVGQSTIIRNGLNTYTAGTTADYTINVSALTINTLIASGNSIFSGTLSVGSSFSASTIYSGSTDIDILFSHTGHTHEFSTILSTAHTHSISEVNNLSGSLNTKVNLSGDTMIGGLITPSLSATTLSGGTILSGSTNLYSIFSPIGSEGGASTFVQSGTNTYTGGTSANPTVNVSALTINTLNASGNSVFSGTLSGGSSFSANTLFSGSTNLNSIFSPSGHTHYGGIGFTIDAHNSVITDGLKGSIIIPYNATIQSWTIIANTSGNVSIDIWKDTFNNYPPTSGDSIVGMEYISLNNEQKNQDLNLTSWNTSVSFGDILSFRIISATTISKVYVMINVLKLN